jgi:RHS repeat-associated protein
VPGTSCGTGLATSALLNTPRGVATDAAGNLYIADTFSNCVREIPVTTGTQRGQVMTADDIYTIAGSAAAASGSSADGTAATSALLWQPVGLAFSTAGDLYIADGKNNRVVEVPAANGTQWSKSMTASDMYTVAGSITKGETGDGGPATAAQMSFAIGVSVDTAGNLYVTDWAGNHVREVTAATTATITPAPGLTSALYPAPGGITVTQPGGAQVTFYSQAGGTCAAPYQSAGQYCALSLNQGATLTANGTTSYTFTPDPGDTSYTYAWDGALTAETDTAGDTLTIAYNTPAPGSGNCPSAAVSCEKITSASGRALIIGSNGSGQVTSVADPMDRAWAYGYNSAGDLTSATDPMSDKTTYTYGAGTTGNPLLANDLLTITGPNAQPGGTDAGKDTINVYNAAGQVNSQTDPMGYTTSFNYCVSAKDGDCLDAATGSGYVTVTGPGGNATLDNYDEGTLASEADHTGSTLTSEQDTIPNTATGTLQDSTTFDGDQNQTSFQYNSAGKPTQTEAMDGAGILATTYRAYTATTEDANCTSDDEATGSSCPAGPGPVSPGSVITPPSSAPPVGVSWTLYDTDGNQLYATTGVYEPGASSAAYSQTSYQLFNGNKVTLPGTSAQISCMAAAPSMSLPCATINPDGVVTQLGYNAQGDQTSASTPDGNGSQIATTTDIYDADGEQTSEISPDGNVPGANAGNQTTATAYNADGEEISVTHGGGTGYTDTPRITSYGFDANGNQTTVQDARGFTTTTTFNADDQPTFVTNPDDNSTLACYDSDGNVAQTVPAVGVAANSLTAISCPTAYPAGYSVRLAADATTDTYDADGQLTAVTTPAPAGQSEPETTAYSYDGAGNLTKIVAPPTSTGGSGQVTVDAYNSAGDLASRTTGYGTLVASTTSYCYDPDENVTATVMPDGNTSAIASCETTSPWAVSAHSYPTQAAYQTTSSYDSADELVSSTSPATTAAPSGATTNYTYDADGDTLTSTDPDGVTTTWTYTPGGQPASKSYSGTSAHSVSYGYDADGNETSMSDATGSSVYSFDSFGELTSAVNGASQTVGYGYNGDGQVATITYPLPAAATWASTDTISYGYDNADELTSVSDFNSHQITIGNTANGAPDSVVLGSTGDTIATDYTSGDYLSAISLKNSSSTLQSFTYSDAPSGNILSETDTPSSAHSPASYTYDATARVTSLTAGTGSTDSFSYDASGNLTALPTSATGTYNDASELTSSTLSSSTTSYAYDADGERTTTKQGSATIASGIWNGAGQLSSYDNSAADMTAATYDGNGVRASTTTTPAGGSATTQNYVWDEDDNLLMDSSLAYIYTGGVVPAEQVNLSTGTITYLNTDVLGSVRGAVNSGGALTGSTFYDTWGNPQTSGGLTAVTPFGYAGGYTDPDGLIYLINRYYDPTTGQFSSVDPDVALTLQPYVYANNDPVSLTDPLGLYWWFYETRQYTCPLDFCAHYYYDYSAKMTEDLDKVAEKFAGKVENARKFLAALSAVIAAVVHSHPEVFKIVAAVTAVLAFVSVKKFTKVVIRLWNRWVKGSGRRARHDGILVNSYYSLRTNGKQWVGATSRSCAAEIKKCGSPGSVIQGVGP